MQKKPSTFNWFAVGILLIFCVALVPYSPNLMGILLGNFLWILLPVLLLVFGFFLKRSLDEVELPHPRSQDKDESNKH